MKLAVIPARGGSKRLPRKNVRSFCGRPVLTYTIAAALQSRCFDRVVVSTDDSEIAEVARSAGAETPFERPRELADDFTGTNAVTAHAIRWFNDRDEHVDLACCLYATAPFLRGDTICEGMRRLQESGLDFVVTVAAFSFPVQRALRRDAAGRLEPIWPTYIKERSQDLEQTYHDAGQMYWGRPEAFLEDRPLFAAATLGLVISSERVQDIDTEEDWHLAEHKFRLLCEGTSLSGPE